MRRLSNITKETALWARAKIVGINELAEAQRTALDSDQYEELEGIYDGMKDDIKSGLFKVFSFELSELRKQFDLTEDQLTKKGTAFPEVEQLDESVVEYVVDLVGDLIELYTMPALDIIDEAEEWLNELWEHHELKGKSGI